MIKEIRVPDIGDYHGVEIIEVGVSDGDTIEAEDALVTLETEKASMDIPAPFAGTLKELKVKVGDKVSQGDLIALVEAAQDGDATSAETTTTTSTQTTAASTTTTTTTSIASNQIKTEMAADAAVHAGPATRQLARELGIDLNRIKGTGRKGRILSTDVIAYTKANLVGGNGLNVEPAPEIDFTQFGEVEVKPLSRIKKWTAKNLHRNWVTIPHVTQFDEADITELDAFRQENKANAQSQGVKLTILPFIMKAVVSALKAYPQFNASLLASGNEVAYKKYFHVGVAVDTPQGLMVPVIKNVDTKGILDCARELAELGAKAKAGKLSNAEMSGSSFTISSLGGVGGTAFTPIVNAPDVAILGLSKVQIKPIYMGHKLMPRQMLPLSLSYDHRVIDGVEAARFTVHLAQQLKDIRNILL